MPKFTPNAIIKDCWSSIGNITGTSEQHQASIAPFFNVLNTYQPDLLIIWGKRLWNNLPGENWIDGSEIQVNGYQVENGYYRLDNGKKVRAVCVYHPSVGYSWDFWYKVICHFTE